MRFWLPLGSSGLAILLAAAGLRAAPPAPDDLAPPESAAPPASAAPAPSPTTSSEAPPYAAWQGQGYAAPGTPPPAAPPPPLVGEPEYARRPVELVPRLGVAF